MKFSLKNNEEQTLLNEPWVHGTTVLCTLTINFNKHRNIKVMCHKAINQAHKSSMDRAAS